MTPSVSASLVSVSSSLTIDLFFFFYGGHIVMLCGPAADHSSVTVSITLTMEHRAKSQDSVLLCVFSCRPACGEVVS